MCFLMQIEVDRIRLTGLGLFQTGMHLVPSVSLSTNYKFINNLKNTFYPLLFTVDSFNHHILSDPSTNAIKQFYFKSFVTYLLFLIYYLLLLFSFLITRNLPIDVILFDACMPILQASVVFFLLRSKSLQCY